MTDVIRTPYVKGNVRCTLSHPGARHDPPAPPSPPLARLVRRVPAGRLRRRPPVRGARRPVRPAGGLLAGLVLGAVQWLAGRPLGLPRTWVPATSAGMGVGSGPAALVAGPPRSCRASWSSAPSPAPSPGSRRRSPSPVRRCGWPGGPRSSRPRGPSAWVVTTSIGVDVERGYIVFGSSGAVVATLLTGLALPRPGSRAAPRRGERVRGVTATQVTGGLLIGVPVLFNATFAEWRPGSTTRTSCDGRPPRCCGASPRAAPLVLLWWALPLSAVLLVPVAVLAAGELRGASGAVVAVGTWAASPAPSSSSASCGGRSSCRTWRGRPPRRTRRPRGRRPWTSCFQAFNRYLGVAVGEHLGYVLTGAWSVLTGVAIRRATSSRAGSASPGSPSASSWAACSLEFVGPVEPAGWALGRRADADRVRRLVGVARGDRRRATAVAEPEPGHPAAASFAANDAAR